MNKSRFDALYAGLPSISKKIYDAIPQRDPWTRPQIMQEIYRVTKSRPDTKVVDGVLLALVDAGLIVQPVRGSFARAKVAVASESAKSNARNDAVVGEVVPVTKVEKLSLRLDVLVTSLTGIAAEIEAIAVEVDRQLSGVSEEVEKLRTLKTLLKELG